MEDQPIYLSQVSGSQIIVVSSHSLAIYDLVQQNEMRHCALPLPAQCCSYNNRRLYVGSGNALLYCSLDEEDSNGDLIWRQALLPKNEVIKAVHATHFQMPTIFVQTTRCLYCSTLNTKTHNVVTETLQNQFDDCVDATFASDTFPAYVYQGCIQRSLTGTMMKAIKITMLLDGFKVEDMMASKPISHMPVNSTKLTDVVCYNNIAVTVSADGKVVTVHGLPEASVLTFNEDVLFNKFLIRRGALLLFTSLASTSLITQLITPKFL